MNDAEDFDAFVAIVDSRSISEAAREMGVPRATLSRQLARLEERLGVRLLHRGTRSLTPTQAGEALYPRARALLDGARATVTAVRRIDDVPRGLLRVTAPPLVSPMLGMLISAFIRDNPDVQVEFRTSTEHFDLAAEQIDIAIRAGVVRDPSLIVRRLFRSDMLAMAAPSYLQDRGHPADVTDLSRHLCLRTFDEASRPSNSWPLVNGEKVAVDGPFVTNDLMALRGAAADGLGIALLPRAVVAPELNSGQLVAVLDGVVGRDVSLSVAWLERKFVDPKVRAFVDLAVEWAAEGRWLLSSDCGSD